RTAEVANQYLTKGSKVLIEGRLRFEQWSDQNGQNRSKHSIQVENMEMLGNSNAPQQGGNFGNNSFSNNNYSGNYE
ncbi:single-stranded DNA-binding protein, partial [Campylobacter coli]|nr:single-stranded DNA-binding protein [Campylobacter coli]